MLMISPYTFPSFWSATKGRFLSISATWIADPMIGNVVGPGQINITLHVFSLIRFMSMVFTCRFQIEIALLLLWNGIISLCRQKYMYMYVDAYLEVG